LFHLLLQQRLGGGIPERKGTGGDERRRGKERGERREGEGKSYLHRVDFL
jgi:hypothetical protein